MVVLTDFELGIDDNVLSSLVEKLRWGGGEDSDRISTLLLMRLHTCKKSILYIKKNIN